MGAIYLIRHGQANFGEADYDRLSALGVEQGAVVGAELLRRDVRFTEARSGSLVRQRKTAETVLDWLGSKAPAKEDPRWNEYDHVDIVARHGGGVPQDATDSRGYQAILDTALGEWIGAAEDSPCAETWPAFLARVSGALEDLISLLGKGESAVVFTSGGVIGTVAGQLLGTPDAGLLRLNRVTVNGGITKLVSGRSGVSLVSFNEHSHFDGRVSRLLTYR
ncbi:histidine phosphatase family protein [Amycolatopsis alkalitolerans]|uniref:Histidine phosphatase family protein n=1 Tax=Amycolatopsis alkalitolerans TaxID=2547244 RepID=A0A5C4LWS1_9PSEU|nr:histidine phosphatase family protein [Amycolatopsis alkalitolerans]TNC21159.1 histidine phosphatase family protein [Amycolatopsis alkalitolerans]